MVSQRLNPSYDLIAFREKKWPSTCLWQIKVELCKRGGIIGSFRCIQDFDPDNPALIVIIDHDSVSQLRAILNGAIGEVDVNHVCLLVHSHTHGLVLSK
jgi:hypothetical protein